MASSEVLTATLHAVTDLKLAQLATQREAYETAKRTLLDKAKDEQSRAKRVHLLLDGAEKLPTMKRLADNPIFPLENLRRYADQAEFDPAVSEGYLADYEDTIFKQLDAQSAKYEFADLYGKLVQEWVSSSALKKADSDPDLVKLGREEMHKQRAQWEEYVFAAKETDASAITKYLDDLFVNSPSKEVAIELETLRKNMKHFQEGFDETARFSDDTVEGCIKGILKSDIITDTKRAALNEFLGNKAVLKEIADVLNMRLKTRASFSWDGVIKIEQRRQLNGRYRFYPDEDLLQTIFLHWIGLQWGVRLRGLLVSFTGMRGVWKSSTQKLSKQTLRRRHYFLSKESHRPLGRGNVRSNAERHWKNAIFLDQLPRDLFERRGSYGDATSEPEETDTRSSPLVVVQELIHRVQTHIILRKNTGRDTTVVRSDFKWFGPSMPHSSLFAVLEYFGVEEEWITFFKKVLETPFVFEDSTQGSTPQVRKRGTPIGTPLSTFFGEALLFCSDFAVNQKANGARLYRLHDDLWLWGDNETCTRGWSALTEFANIMGLEFNEEKTGSCRIPKNGSTEPENRSPNLPDGNIVWGFLKLDSTSGRFLIDQHKVDEHINELDLQLKACTSVFDFIQAWNLYGARYFRNNCGKVAACFGRPHVDAMLKTFKHIQSKVFQSSEGSVGQHLKHMIERRLGVENIPDGFIYYPTAMGGLGLHNPLIDLYLIRDNSVKEPEDLMKEFWAAERSEYGIEMEAFEDGYTSDVESSTVSDDDMPLREKPLPVHLRLSNEEWEDLRGEEFMSFEEYSKNSEITSVHLGRIFNRLLESPMARNVTLTGEAKVLSEHDGETKELQSWSSYEIWVVQLYAKEMIARFGSLNVIEQGMLPSGLITMLRQSRFNWQN